MGSNQSSTSNNIVDIYQKNVTEVINKRSQTVVAVSTNINQARIRAKKVTGCNVALIQAISVDAKLSAYLRSMNSTEIKNILNQALDQTANQSQKATNDFLQTAFSNQDTTSNNVTKFKNEIINRITDETFQNCKSIIQNINQGIIEIGEIDCTKGGDLKLDQSIVVKSVVDCSLDAITTVSASNEGVLKAIQDLTQSQAAENKGLGDVIANVMSMMKSVGVIIGIVVLIITVVLIFFAGKVLMSPAGQEALSKATDKAVNKL